MTSTPSRAFDVNAIDYLLKPFDRSRVHQALERVRQRLQEAPSPGRQRPSASESQIGALLKLIEQQFRPPRRPAALSSRPKAVCC